MNPDVVVTGVVSGALYALSAVALVIVYRASRLINFALGGMGGLAAYVAFATLSSGGPYYVGYLIALAVGGLVGWGTEWFIVRRLSGTSHIVGAIATLGVLLVLQGVVVARWSTETRALPAVYGSSSGLQLGALHLSGNDLYILAVTILALGMLYVLLFRTRLGLRMRATAEGPVTAALVGVDIRSTSRWSWVIGGISGSLAALLIIPTISLSPQSFTEFLFFSFAAVVLGGLTSVVGVVLGGIVFGVAINLLEYFVTTRLVFTAGMIFATVILLFRPQGLLGIVERSVPEVKGLNAHGFVRRAGPTLRRLHVRAKLGTNAAALRVRSGMPRAHRSPSRVERIVLFVVVVVVLIGLPAVLHAGTASVLPTFAGAILAVLGLTILQGTAGRISVGNGAFLAVGAYTTAILVQRGVPFLFALVIAAAISFFVGLVVGLPALRIRSYVYFAVYTFMVASAVPELIVYFSNWTGGENGLTLTVPFEASTAHLYWFLLAITAIVMGIAALIVRSGTGRRWRAARDSAEGAAAVGINVGAMTALAFGVSAAITGIGGALEGAAVGTLSPESYSIWTSVYLLVGVVIGGAGSFGGAIIGAAFISFIPYFAGSGTSLSPDLIYGVVLMVVIVLAPGGVVRACGRAAESVDSACKAWMSRWRSRRRVGRRTEAFLEASPNGVRQPSPDPRSDLMPPTQNEEADQSIVDHIAVAQTSDPVGESPPGPLSPERYLLQVASLVVDYDGLVAVRGVDLAVAEGQVVALVGPNGAGKSSILRAMGGVARAREGSVTFYGEELVGRRPWQIARMGISYVVEGRGVFPGLTVEENLALGGLLSKSAAARVRESRSLVYDLFPELAARSRQLAGSLSGGQQQMVAIGRGLMARPRLLVLDEPSLGLAPVLAEQVFRQLQSMKDSGLSMLIVEQNSTLALGVADWVYVLRNGQVQLTCASDEARGKEALIAEYLGVRL